MSARRYWHKFTVEGRGAFPLDMLRFDRCYPYSPDDVARILGRDRREVTLAMWSESQIGPTTARWDSFGWPVVAQEMHR